MLRATRILVSCVLLLPSITLAVPVTVDFTITATNPQDGAGNPVASYNGYGPGTMGSGSFTFDDSVGSFLETVDGLVASALDFSWLGNSWDESNARISWLAFDPSGGLATWTIGAWIPGYDCDIGCVASVGPTDFWVGDSGFGAVGVLHDVSTPGFMFGSVAWSSRPATPVPEPSSLALLLLGVLGMTGMPRRFRTAP